MMANRCVLVETDEGNFTILLDATAAPITVKYFEGLIQNGVFNDSIVFRIVNEENASFRQHAPIEVIQLGFRHQDVTHDSSVPMETTRDTGLLHKQWTVSAARCANGDNYPSFFICMRDEPELDFGGSRHPDGQGFAAFGRIVNGFDVVIALFEKAEEAEYLKNPPLIRRLSIVS